MAGESSMERSLRTWCKARGIECLKLRPVVFGEGFPDRTILIPGGIILFMETKTAVGTVRDKQKWWIAHLQKLGFKAVVCRSLEEAKNAVTKLSTGGETV